MKYLLPFLAALLTILAGAQDSTPTIQLKAIKKIYIDKMDNDLDQYLRAEITKQFKGKLLVVLNPEDADAIMAGIESERKGTAAVVTGRYFGLHDLATGSISVLDKNRKVVLWASEAGDRNLFSSIAHRGGARKVADRLIHNLKSAMGQ